MIQGGIANFMLFQRKILSLQISESSSATSLADGVGLWFSPAFASCWSISESQSRCSVPAL